MRMMDLYQLYEFNRASITASNAFLRFMEGAFKQQLSPIAKHPLVRVMREVHGAMERSTRFSKKPEFGIKEVMIEGNRVPIRERIIWHQPFCRLIRFERVSSEKEVSFADDPKVLLVAPMSGHYATMLREMVKALAVRHDVYVTDWENARDVPISQGGFDLSDYIDYITLMFRAIEGEVHVIGVNQSSVPVLAMVSLLSSSEEKKLPSSMVLMGGPIDVRASENAVSRTISGLGLDWFRDHAIMRVPSGYLGRSRQVYPGFLQMYGLTSSTITEHLSACRKSVDECSIGGTEGSVAEKGLFYDEYFSTMDMTAEFFLQSIETVFVKHLLPTGRMKHRGTPVEPSAIRETALMTIRGDMNQFIAPGQTRAAHDLCHKIPSSMKADYLQPGAGHYDMLFSSCLRSEIVPRISRFIRQHRKQVSTLLSSTSVSVASTGSEKETSSEGSAEGVKAGESKTSESKTSEVDGSQSSATKIGKSDSKEDVSKKDDDKKPVSFRSTSGKTG